MIDFLNSPAGVVVIAGIFGIIITIIITRPLTKAANRIAVAVEEHNEIALRTAADDLAAVRRDITAEIDAHDEKVYAAAGREIDQAGRDLHRVYTAVASMARTLRMSPEHWWQGDLETPDTRPRDEGPVVDTPTQVQAAIPGATRRETVEAHPVPPTPDLRHPPPARTRPPDDESPAERAGYHTAPGHDAGAQADDELGEDPGTNTGRITLQGRGWVRVPGRNYPHLPFDPDDREQPGRRAVWEYILSRLNPGVMPWMPHSTMAGFQQYHAVRALIMSEFGFALHSNMFEEFPNLQGYKPYQDWLAQQPRG